MKCRIADVEGVGILLLPSLYTIGTVVHSITRYSSRPST